MARWNWPPGQGYRRRPAFRSQSARGPPRWLQRLANTPGRRHAPPLTTSPNGPGRNSGRSAALRGAPIRSRTTSASTPSTNAESKDATPPSLTRTYVRWGFSPLSIAATHLLDPRRPSLLYPGASFSTRRRPAHRRPRNAACHPARLDGGIAGRHRVADIDRRFHESHASTSACLSLRGVMRRARMNPGPFQGGWLG